MSLLSSSSIWKRGQDQASQFNTDSTQTRKGAKRKKPTWMFSLSLKKRIEITHFGLKIKRLGVQLQPRTRTGRLPTSAPVCLCTKSQDLKRSWSPLASSDKNHSGRRGILLLISRVNSLVSYVIKPWMKANQEELPYGKEKVYFLPAFLQVLLTGYFQEADIVFQKRKEREV